MEKTLKVIGYISTPFEKYHNEEWKLKPTDSPDILLEEIVSKCEENIESLEYREKLGADCGPLTSTWTFTTQILSLLLKLKEQVVDAEKNQAEEEKCIQVLSVGAQLDVGKCVELVVGFGLLPHLLPNVGVPEKVRKRNSLVSELFLKDEHRLNPLIKFHRLAKVLDALMEISTNPSLHSLIIPKYAADILSAFFQICNSPISAPSSRPGALSQNEFEYVMKIRQQIQGHLESFISTIPQSVLVNSLFLIGEQPKFMRTVCTEIIQKMLLSTPNGLFEISSTLLSESSPSNTWNLKRVISFLLKDSLNKIIQEPFYAETFEHVCKQCVQMISINQQQQEKIAKDEKLSDDKGIIINSNNNTTNANMIGNPSPFGMNNKELSRIGLCCAIVLMEINCQRSQTFVWDHLFEAVLVLGSSQSQDQCEMGSINREKAQQLTRVNNDIIADIERIIGASEIAEGLLSLVIPTGISISIHVFQPLWSLLLQILVACRKYLEKKVQEPSVAQLAQVLNTKLENVFILVLEVVSSGLGDKIDLDIKTTRTAGLDKASTPVNKHIAEERAKSLLDFCIQLIVNESDAGETGVYNFELVSMPNSPNLLEQCVYEKVKIVRRKNDISTCSLSRCDDDDNDREHSSNNINEKAFEVVSDECAALCSILKHERLVHITSELFRQLLNYENENVSKQGNGNSLRRTEQKVGETTKISSTSLKKSSNSTSDELTQLELELEGNVMNNSTLRKFAALKLLEGLGGDENTIENCVRTDDYKETLQIVELVMKKLTTELKESSYTGEDYEFSQTIIFALGFLGTIVETATLKEKSTDKKKDDDGEFWDELQRFIPHLNIIAECDNLGLVNSALPSMADNILISITSRGKTGNLGKDKVKIVKSEYQKALEDVSNPMLPVKGHGLLQLKRLIEVKDSETLKNDAFLLQMFQTELGNDDSYVYLMAIQGLAALGLKFHKIVIPVLIEEYDFINADRGVERDRCKRAKMYKAMTENERIECRMKIGEVLVKIIQQLGQMAPVYKVPLTNLFFRIVRDDEPLIRASALSNLGELCHLLKFSLSSILTEVWQNVESILNFEKDAKVRRAALHLMVLLLKGVEKEFNANHLLMDVEVGGYLRDARRLLTRIEQGETDSVARTHAQLALHELQLIAKKLLLPKQQGELNYKIRVLDITK